MSRSRIVQFLTKSIQSSVHQQRRQFHKEPLQSRPLFQSRLSHGKWLGLGIAGGIIAGTLYYANKKRQADKSEETYIVTIGSLLQLNYQACIASFKQIAAKEGKSFNLTGSMFQDIFKEDDRFKRGEINEHEFRIKINGILGINASDKEFDNAWNAMLGDTQVLADRMKAIKSLNINIAFLSGTNPIHAKKLGIDQWRDAPVFLSYQNRCLGIECYKKIVAQLNLNPHKTTLVSRFDNLNAGSISERNQQAAKTVEEWAELQGIKTCKCDAQSEIVSAIHSCLAEQQAKESVSVQSLQKR